MNLEYLEYPVELEIRRGGRGGGRSISGKFGLSGGKLRRYATMRNRGKRRKEMIDKRAFRWSLRMFKQMKDDLDKLLKEGAAKQAVEEATEALSRRNIHILAGHSFDKPLGSLMAGTATIKLIEDEADPRLEFSVDLPDSEEDWPSHVSDTVKSIEMGLVGGVSPGFLMPDPKVVKNAEEFIPEPGNEEVLIRKINEAVLVELSLVTRPAYSQSEVTAREDEEQEEGDTDRQHDFDDMQRHYVWL
ncbi:MAG: hypothetical protein F4X63_09225 [Nitrospira sp. SB0662_bin_26]|nr:hypothetical protein [Nitrospira sp. SB0662_bin_26]